MPRTLPIAFLLAACSSAPASDKPQKIELSLDDLGSLHMIARELRSAGPIEPIDLSYKSTYTIRGPQANITIWPRENSKPVSFRSTLIEAEYAHIAGLLTVKVLKPDTTDEYDFHYFVEPIRWDSE